MGNIIFVEPQGVERLNNISEEYMGTIIFVEPQVGNN